MSRFLASAEIFFGDSGLQELSERLNGEYSSIGLVYDVNILGTSGFLKLTESIKTLNARVSEFPIALRGEPTYGFLNKMRDRIKDAGEVDLIVAVGGGECDGFRQGARRVAKVPS